MNDINKKLREELKKCRYAGSIHLCHCRLGEIPPLLISSGPDLSCLRRLDLSNNNISIIPPEIGEFTELRELWLQNNPITTLPIQIEHCLKLEVIDLKNTLVNDLPAELCNLKKLFELDFSETPFATYVATHFEIKTSGRSGLVSLKRIFQDRYERQCLKAATVEKLMGELYVKECDDPNSLTIVGDMVELLDHEFTNLDEFKLFCRRADKLLPETLAAINEHTIKKSKEKFLSMRDSTRRDRMAAEVEIKLRNIYFDRIEREAVEAVIQSIFQHVASLEDMQFLVKYAAQVFPPSPDNACGEVIWNNILNLQADLTSKREGAVRNLISSMLQLYPEQIPSDVEQKGREVAKAFRKERFATKRELNNLSRLAVDASQVFPPDFVSCTPSDVAAQAKAVFGKG